MSKIIRQEKSYLKTPGWHWGRGWFVVVEYESSQIINSKICYFSGKSQIELSDWVWAVADVSIFIKNLFIMLHKFYINRQFPVYLETNNETAFLPSRISGYSPSAILNNFDHLKADRNPLTTKTTQSSCKVSISFSRWTSLECSCRIPQKFCFRRPSGWLVFSKPGRKQWNFNKNFIVRKVSRPKWNWTWHQQEQRRQLQLQVQSWNVRQAQRVISMALWRFLESLETSKNFQEWRSHPPPPPFPLLFWPFEVSTTLTHRSPATIVKIPLAYTLKKANLNVPIAICLERSEASQIRQLPVAEK